MPNTSTYNNPPIQEALIDIKVVYPDEFDLNEVEKLHESFKEDLPQKTARNSVVFSINQDGPDVNANKIDGFMFRASDGSRVLQITKEGFTFSYINVYTTWEDFIVETMKYWEAFVTSLSPTKISRIGVRFINRINLPGDTSDLSQYFKTQVSLGDIENKPTELFLRAVIPYDGGTCIITEAVNPNLKTDEQQGYIIDIDAFNEVELEISDEGLSSTLARLRDIKNDAFEKSITDKTRELFS